MVIRKQENVFENYEPHSHPQGIQAEFWFGGLLLCMQKECSYVLFHFWKFKLLTVGQGFPASQPDPDIKTWERETRKDAN